MNICMLARSFQLSRGGTGRVALELRNRVTEAGHLVTTVEAPDAGVLGYAKFGLIDCLIRRPRADVYHAISPIEGMWLPREYSVVTYHDLFILSDPERVGAGVAHSNILRELARLYWRYAAILSSRARALVAVSDDTKQVMMKHLNIAADKVTVIRSGIPDELDYIPRPPRGEDDPLIFGYLGQLDRRKRVDMLIRAFRTANEHGCLDADLAIGGMGIDEAHLRELAGDNPRIHFFGLIADCNLNSFYNGLDWFVFPTMLEGYGLPPVEAMACKVPVVVMKDAIIPDEVKRRCFQTEDLTAFLINAPKIKVTGLEDNYHWAKSHDWARAVGEYISIYEEVKKR